MKHSLFILLNFIFLTNFFINSHAFVLKGYINNSEKEPLGFATLHIKNTSIGTSTNVEGFYALTLASGKYDIVYQYVGYQSKTITVEIINQDVVLDVVLESEGITLNEININANDEDPAYAIIREAIKKRKQHLEEIESFNCNTYLKGLNNLVKAPKQILGRSIGIDTGVVYLSESVSELSYQKPNDYKEKMISSKVSGNSQGFSFNQASEMNLNFYENLIENDNFSERGLVSPIANNAFLYYDYKYLGYMKEGKLTINKIMVIPKQKGSTTFAGIIYIIEDQWRIHSTDLYVPKGVIDFIDSVSIRQFYTPLEDGKVWALLSQKFEFQFKAFGFEGDGYFVCIYSDYSINPTFEKKYFNNEVLKVEEEANQKDSIYWKSVRPIPLTNKEVKDYVVKDSMEIIKKTKTYLDSTDRKKNKFNINSLFLFGYSYQNSYRKYRLSLDPLGSIFQYNTVEGFVLNLNVDYRKSFEDRSNYLISPTIRYGFGNDQWMGKLRYEYNYSLRNNGLFALEGGRYIEQFNRQNPISPTINSLYTILQEQNFMKIFDKYYARAEWRQELFNGFTITTAVEYAQRNPMFNTSDYKSIEFKDRDFTPNTPFNLELPDTGFLTHNTLQWNINFRIRFAEKYITYPNRKFTSGSKYPTINLNYRKALLDTDFDFASIVIDDEMTFGTVGTTQYQIGGGTFLNTNRIYFMDFYHFNGNQTIFNKLGAGLGQYFLLDYYQYSTPKTYLRAHWEHHFNGFLTNAIPLFKKLKWQLVASANFLHTEKLNAYTEVGIGMEHIFKFLRVDYIWGFTDNKTSYLEGVRLGFGF